MYWDMAQSGSTAAAKGAEQTLAAARRYRQSRRRLRQEFELLNDHLSGSPRRSPRAAENIKTDVDEFASRTRDSRCKFMRGDSNRTADGLEGDFARFPMEGIGKRPGRRFITDHI